MEFKDAKKSLARLRVVRAPSRSELFGIAILEALACRKPVIATKTGDIPKIIENGRSGILVERDDPAQLADAIIRVLNDRNLQKTMADNGYAKVNGHFRWENTGAAYEAVFQGLMSASPGLACKRSV